MTATKPSPAETTQPTPADTIPAACRDCGGRPATRIGSFPAGDTRSPGVADYIAAHDKATTGADTHVHYNPRDDAFTVVRPLQPWNADT